MRKLSVLILVILGLNLKSIRFVSLLVISYFFPSSELVLRMIVAAIPASVGAKTRDPTRTQSYLLAKIVFEFTH